MPEASVRNGDTEAKSATLMAGRYMLSRERGHVLSHSNLLVHVRQLDNDTTVYVTPIANLLTFGKAPLNVTYGFDLNCSSVWLPALYIDIFLIDKKVIKKPPEYSRQRNNSRAGYGSSSVLS
jgi:hypothetical protein